MTLSCRLTVVLLALLITLAGKIHGSGPLEAEEASRGIKRPRVLTTDSTSGGASMTFLGDLGRTTEQSEGWEYHAPSAPSRLGSDNDQPMPPIYEVTQTSSQAITLRTVRGTQANVMSEETPIVVTPSMQTPNLEIPIDRPLNMRKGPASSPTPDPRTQNLPKPKVPINDKISGRHPPKMAPPLITRYSGFPVHHTITLAPENLIQERGTKAETPITPYMFPPTAQVLSPKHTEVIEETEDDYLSPTAQPMGVNDAGPSTLLNLGNVLHEKMPVHLANSLTPVGIDQEQSAFERQPTSYVQDEDFQSILSFLTEDEPPLPHAQSTTTELTVAPGPQVTTLVNTKIPYQETIATVPPSVSSSAVAPSAPNTLLQPRSRQEPPHPRYVSILEQQAELINPPVYPKYEYQAQRPFPLTPRAWASKAMAPPQQQQPRQYPQQQYHQQQPQYPQQQSLQYPQQQQQPQYPQQQHQQQQPQYPQQQYHQQPPYPQQQHQQHYPQQQYHQQQPRHPLVPPRTPYLSKVEGLPPKAINWPTNPVSTLEQPVVYQPPILQSSTQYYPDNRSLAHTTMAPPQSWSQPKVQQPPPLKVTGVPPVPYPPFEPYSSAISTAGAANVQTMAGAADWSERAINSARPTLLPASAFPHPINNAQGKAPALMPNYIPGAFPSNTANLPPIPLGVPQLAVRGAAPPVISPWPIQRQLIPIPPPRVEQQQAPPPPTMYQPQRPYSQHLQRHCALHQFQPVDKGGLNSGAFGSVYLVKDIHGPQHEIFAMKQIKAEKVKKHLRHVIAEETIHFGLDHPNLAQFHCTMVSKDTGDVYFLLEYVPGQDLLQYIRSLTRPATVKTVGSVIGQLSLALRYLHERGIVHRDLKTENVMYMSSGQVKLIDFGLAAHSRNDQLTDYVGTIRCSAPELFEAFRGECTYGRPSDYYSLGVVAYELRNRENLYCGPSKECLKRRMQDKWVLKAPNTGSVAIDELLEILLDEDQHRRWSRVYENFASYQRLRVFSGFSWGNVGLLPIPWGSRSRGKTLDTKSSSNYQHSERDSATDNGKR